MAAEGLYSPWLHARHLSLMLAGVARPDGRIEGRLLELPKAVGARHDGCAAAILGHVIEVDEDLD